MSFVDLIEKKRDGAEHTSDELALIVSEFSRGHICDYQMTAWLMAAYIRGLSDDETIWLTDAMARSGDTLDLSSIPGIKVDKHSTGGVADTTTLVVAPLVAACGVPVAKMSGRGLGHTGGTLDKLESIPGFRVDLTQEEFIRQVGEVGVAVVAQSDEVAPADRAIYALRDVTATVSSVPLIVSSILSKKIAGGADAVLLDVKSGSGAFMKTPSQARDLANALERTGAALGRSVECVLTDMDQPLGRAVGNALEVAEAIRTLSGAGPVRLTQLCEVLAAKMLVLGGAAADETSARRIVRKALDSGQALAKFEEWVRAQGGDPRIVTRPETLPKAPFCLDVIALASGYVGAVDALAIGRAAVDVGAGRECKGQRLDPSAGIEMLVGVGDSVQTGERLALIHSADMSSAESARARVQRAVSIVAERPEEPALFVGE